MIGPTNHIVKSYMGPVDACPDWAVGTICAFVSPLIAAAATVIGTTAASIAVPAVIGAGVGALGAAVTGGNIGQGALFGGLTGGVAGGFGALGADAVGDVGGAAADAGVSDAALTGGVSASDAAAGGLSGFGSAAAGGGGFLSNVGQGLSSAANYVGNEASSLFGGNAPVSNAGVATNMAAQLGTTVDSSGLIQSGPFAGMSINDPSVQAALNNTDAYSAGNLANTSNALDSTAKTSGATAAGAGAASKGLNTTSLALGALAGLGQALAPKPTQAPVSSVTGPLSSTVPAYMTQPLSTAGAGTPRTAVNPGLPVIQGAAQPNAYAAYGGPEQTYFSNNYLTQPYGGAAPNVAAPALGAAHGGSIGALSRYADGGRHPVSSAHGDHYVQGPGDGQSDSIPARLADGEFIMDATTVSRLGNGSNAAGAKKLEEMRRQIAHDAGSSRVVQKKVKPVDHYLGGRRAA